MKHLKYGLSALLAAALMLPAWASADDWEFGKKLSFDTTNTGVEIDQDVSALPVLVRLHSGNFKFAEAKPDGSDLRFFAADNKTPLAFHIERFDADNELAVVWVKLPKLKAKAKTDTLMVRWGNKGAAAAGESKSVYDESQVLVLNFSEADGLQRRCARGGAGFGQFGTQAGHRLDTDRLGQTRQPGQGQFAQRGPTECGLGCRGADREDGQRQRSGHAKAASRCLAACGRGVCRW
jgi:hypothetical protein